jgi:hypothetical protein
MDTLWPGGSGHVDALELELRRRIAERAYALWNLKAAPSGSPWIIGCKRNRRSSASRRLAKRTTRNAPTVGVRAGPRAEPGRAKGGERLVACPPSRGAYSQ